MASESPGGPILKGNFITWPVSTEFDPQIELYFASAEDPSAWPPVVKVTVTTPGLIGHSSTFWLTDEGLLRFINALQELRKQRELQKKDPTNVP